MHEQTDEPFKSKLKYCDQAGGIDGLVSACLLVQVEMNVTEGCRLWGI